MRHGEAGLWKEGRPESRRELLCAAQKEHPAYPRTAGRVHREQFKGDRRERRSLVGDGVSCPQFPLSLADCQQPGLTRSPVESISLVFSSVPSRMRRVLGRIRTIHQRFRGRLTLPAILVYSIPGLLMYAPRMFARPLLGNDSDSKRNSDAWSVEPLFNSPDVYCYC